MTANSLVFLTRLYLRKNACPLMVRCGSQNTSPKEGSKHANQTEPAGASGLQSVAPEDDANLPREVLDRRSDSRRDAADPHQLSSGCIPSLEQSGAEAQ